MLWNFGCFAGGPASIGIFQEEFWTSVLNSYLRFGAGISEDEVNLIISFVVSSFKGQRNNSFCRQHIIFDGYVNAISTP